ncbi:TPA: type IV secretion system protein [Streptococcus suis]
MPKFDFDALTKTLSEYSPNVSKLSSAAAQATHTVALVIISFLLMLELMNTYQLFKREGGSLNVKLIAELALRYLIAILLVHYFSVITSSILWLFNGIASLIQTALGTETATINYDIGKVKGITKQIISLIVWATENVAAITGNILILLRYLDMYVLEIIGPVIVPFYMLESTKQLSINVFKHFGAAALQGVLLVIVMSIYPALMTDALLEVNVSDKAQVVSVAISSIAKGIIFIMLMVGTNRRAKQLFGVM